MLTHKLLGTAARYEYAGLDDDEPIAVSPERTKRLLGIGTTHLYELLNAGELDSFKSGKARRVTMVSIKAYVERQLAEARAAWLGEDPEAAAVKERIAQKRAELQATADIRKLAASRARAEGAT